ncbi:MAG: phosphoglucosamine mutase [Nitrososphaerota archaeon]|jgi:phosphoglucosamine mutase|nr:phosphoglucosamine mutase [Nitrososphaerota archaeon]
MVKLFGSSGVRGLANIDLTPVLACKVATAVATYANAKLAIVARDTRVSGNMFEDALVSGLTSAGTDVLLSDRVPTPVLAYAAKVYGADTGFMLTASHNPPQYNGIKVFKSDLSYTDADQAAVEKIIANNSYRRADWRKLGKVTPIDAQRVYLDMVLNQVKLAKPWHVVVDSGCGAAYNVAPKMFRALGCKVIALNSQPDGYFPARKSEPTAESLQDLAKTVKALGADIGVAFDGDADRVAFVDEKGAFVNFDRALAAYAAYTLKHAGGGVVVTTIEASMAIETMAQKYGGKVLRTRVGDIYISEAIKHCGAVFGGEPCGAWIQPQQHLCPDGPLSGVMFLSALEAENKTVSEFINEVPEYPTTRVNFACSNEQKHKLIEQLGSVLKAEFPDYTDFSTIDGTRLSLKNGWLLVRASGTEPLIRLTVEGQSEAATKDITSKTTALINKQNEAP